MSHVTTTQIAAVALLNSLLAAPASAATTYDLTTQWVNGTNPNGPWSLVQGSTPLPYVKVWTSWPTTPKLTRQSAFAPGPITNTHPGDYIPAWFKSTANYSFGTGLGGLVKGKIGLHTTDPANGASNGAASAVFVAPSAGVATISGVVYSLAYLGRPQAWQVTVNGTVEASGTDPNDGSISYANPAKFNLKKVALNVGDVVEFTIYQTGGLGDFMGADLNVVIP